MIRLKKILILLMLPLVSITPNSCKSAQLPQMSHAIYIDTSQSVPIMSCGLASTKQMVDFFLDTNPDADVEEVSQIARFYIEEAALEGVNHDIAFCQMLIETNYLRFTGIVCRTQNNFAGIGATGPDIQGDSFDSMRIGVRAQIQHLKAYGSKDRIKNKKVDPRFEKPRRGSALYVEQLAEKWSTDPRYGNEIRIKLRLLAEFIAM